jgi:hypothetical protein
MDGDHARGRACIVFRQLRLKMVGPAKLGQSGYIDCHCRSTISRPPKRTNQIAPAMSRRAEGSELAERRAARRRGNPER